MKILKLDITVVVLTLLLDNYGTEVNTEEVELVVMHICKVNMEVQEHRGLLESFGLVKMAIVCIQVRIQEICN